MVDGCRQSGAPGTRMRQYSFGSRGNAPKTPRIISALESLSRIHRKKAHSDQDYRPTARTDTPQIGWNYSEDAVLVSKSCAGDSKNTMDNAQVLEALAENLQLDSKYP
jgi:hypothetical protein